MKISIESVSNGYVLDSSYHDGERIVQDVQVFEIDEFSETGEQAAVITLLHQVMDRIGFNNSKHNKYRIKIELEEQCLES